jgi:50S ribosome-binding GTPase
VTAIRPPLRDQVRELLLDAAGVYRDSPSGARFERAAQRLDGPLLVAIAGRVKAGKSTLLNALAGRVVAATDAGECTRVITSYAWGEQVSATAVLRSGVSGVVRVPVIEDGDTIRLDLSGVDVDAVERFEVLMPSPALERVTLIDTPGIGSLTPQAGASSEQFLSDPTRFDAPDAVIYLLRQAHMTDVDFLEAFRDPIGRTVPPVNGVGVLSHADEIGGGGPGALAIAHRLADTYAGEPRMRPLVQTVVAVAGLMAEASATLTQAEHDDLVELAQVDPGVTDPMLLSASRFGAPRRYLPVGPEARQALLARLGVFGVRWALELVRAGRSGTRDRLRAELARTSGLTTLGAVLGSQILGRRDVLKAGAALQLVLHAVTTEPVRDSARLSAAAERIRVGVHDFDELRLLNELRLGVIEVPDAERRRMERLLGARGGAVHERLGLVTGDSGPAVAGQDLLTAIAAEHAHWHGVGSDVLAPPPLTRACAVLERTCAQLHASVRAATTTTTATTDTTST